MVSRKAWPEDFAIEMVVNSNAYALNDSVIINYCLSNKEETENVNSSNTAEDYSLFMETYKQIKAAFRSFVICSYELQLVPPT